MCSETEYVHTFARGRLISVAWPLAVVVLLAAYSLPAAIPVTDAANRFLVAQWTTDNGLPQNTVTSMVQTRDGYLWVGTFGGLARFDGISFTVFDAASTPVLKSNRVLSLFEDSHGTLWIGAETGEIYLLKDRQFRELDVGPGVERSTVWAFSEDTEGALLIASNTGLERVLLGTNGDVVPATHQFLSSQSSNRLARDPQGRVWAKVGSQIFLVENSSLIAASERGIQFPRAPQQMTFDPDGRAFVANYGSLGIADANGYEEFLRLDNKVNKGAFGLTTHDGGLWFQQLGELYEIEEGRGIRYDLARYIEGGSRALLFDREDNLWVGTQYNGLVRLTRRKIELLSDLANRPVDGVYSIAQDRQGTVWVAAGEQLLGLNGTSVERIDAVDGPGRFPVVRSLAVDANGTLWAGGTFGLYYLRDHKLVAVPALEKEHIHALYFDAQNRLWIGAANGLGVLDNGQYRQYTTLDGLADNSVHFIMQARDGAMWIGTFHGVSVFRGEKFENITTSNGLGADYVRDIVEDTDGTMWFATYGGGITSLRAGKMSTIDRSAGLPNNFVSRILVDRNSRFWILTNVGILAVDRDELNAVADGLSAVLAGSLYDKLDGMPSSEANGGHQAAGTVTSDGRLWFPMLKDVVIIDPRPDNSEPPAVVIEDASTRGTQPEKRVSQIFAGDEPFVIQNGFRNLEISYTGLSFREPEAIRFFYMLEGLDKEWINAGNRRTAFYPYLPAGDYTFQVKALSSDGVWSVSPATFRISVKQHFWETRWFWVVLALAASALCVVYFMSYRKRQAEQRTREQEFSRRLINAQEAERRRMAAELHDGLGQNLLLIKNWAHVARTKEGEPSVMTEYLDKIEEASANSIEEAREIAQHLSPQIVERFGLTEAIVNIVDQIEDATGIEIETKLDNIDGLFDAEAETYVYRIVQELMNNIVRHSESPTARLDIDRVDSAVNIMIEDLGKGFNVNDLTADTEHKGIGLRSIAQRLRLINGDLTIRSQPGRGTRISISLRPNRSGKEQNNHPYS